jgi:predicted ATPase
MLPRLARRLPLLTGGRRDAPARHTTMGDAIAWSYDLLSPAEQATFRRLAIFVGGFPLEAVEAIAAPDPGDAAGPPVVDLLSSLVDYSLLQRGEMFAGDALLPRYSMLETIREFGLEQLATCGETETTLQRHAAWCVQLAEMVRQSGKLSQGSGLVTLETEHPNLWAALTWMLASGETTSTLHLAGLLAEFWLRHGHLDEGQGWLESALAADKDPPTAARAEALVGLTMLLWLRHEPGRAAELLHEAEVVARAAGDAGVLAYTRLH